MDKHTHYPLPTMFHSDGEGKAFTHCKVCDIDLQQSHVPYTIEKAYQKQADGSLVTLFEIAVCMPCAQKQSQKMSKESRAFITQTLMNEKTLKKRKDVWENNWEEEWDKKCFFSNEETSSLKTFHIVGQFQNEAVIPGEAPMVIGEELLNYLQENLSKETKDEFNDFAKTHLGPDPHLAKLLEEHQFILV